MSHIEHDSPAGEAADPHYCIAARYRSERTAGRAYTRAQSALLNAEGCDLSSYRLQLDQIWHVAVLGEQPAPELDRRLRMILAGGDPVTFPADVVAALLARRAAAIELGPWVERHHRPGERIGQPDWNENP